jgi:hypothetical protein
MPTSPTTSSPPLLQKLVLVGLECNIDVKAQYNPKEVSIEKSLSWTPSPNSKDDRPDLAFGSVAARTLSMELMFDTYEDETDVQTYLGQLMRLASVIDPATSNHTEKDKRPSMVQVVWGKPDMPIFRGVIQSMSTKLTMFLPNGTPVRATCNIKILEASGYFGDPKKKPKKPPGSPTAW